MAVWVSGVLLLVTVTVVTGSCTAGRYGYHCSYQCHCPEGYCSPTSGCQSANCFRGWSGSTCQKENVAFNKTTSSSSVYFEPSNAVNGDTRGDDEKRCFHSAYNNNTITFAWWRVDLGNITLVHDVIIYFRTNYKVRRNGIQIYIADTAASPTDGVNCFNVTGNRDGTDIPDVLTATCSSEGRYLVVYTTTVNNEPPGSGLTVPVMDFCEVEVEVCAPGTFGNDCDNYCHCEGDACNYVNGICPSGVCLPGWQTDRCDTECDLDRYGTNCIKLCSYRQCKGDNSSCDHVTGQCVGGCKTGWNGSDCSEKCINSYGEDCAHLCSSRKCNGISSCNHVTGKCENGCVPGWKNVDCTEACVQGTEYGAGCLKTCSARMCQGDASTCPRDTGWCTDGCLAGWKGEDCTTACAVGVEYGVGCGKTCSTRMCQGDTSSCPQGTGRCTDGCQAGWKGEDCTTACIDGVKYGVGCAKNCSARKCKEATTPCPQDTGRCDGGCQPGWVGEDCTSECPSRTFGVNCTSTCGHCVDDEPCHHVTCLKSGSAGRFSYTCRLAVDNLPREATDQISPLVAGCIGAVAMLVLLTVVAGAVCVWRKGDFRMTKTPRDSSSPETRPAPPVEVPAYDVLPENDYTKLNTIQTEHYDTLQPTVDYQNSDVRI